MVKDREKTHAKKEKGGDNMATANVVNIKDYEPKQDSVCEWDAIRDIIGNSIKRQGLSKEEVAKKLEKIKNSR